MVWCQSLYLVEVIMQVFWGWASYECSRLCAGAGGSEGFCSVMRKAAPKHIAPLPRFSIPIPLILCFSTQRTASQGLGFAFVARSWLRFSSFCRPAAPHLGSFSLGRLHRDHGGFPKPCFFYRHLGTLDLCSAACGCWKAGIGWCGAGPASEHPSFSE